PGGSAQEVRRAGHDQSRIGRVEGPKLDEERPVPPMRIRHGLLRCTYRAPGLVPFLGTAIDEVGIVGRDKGADSLHYLHRLRRPAAGLPCPRAVESFLIELRADALLLEPALELRPAGAVAADAEDEHIAAVPRP